MLIAIINRSSLISNEEVNLMCQAIQIQLDLHFCPAYNMKSIPIKFYANELDVPGYAWTIYMIDNDTQVEGALGYHQEVNDKVDGYIICEPILSNGGVVLAFDANNPGQYSVSATLSHEVLETFMDRFTNTYCDDGQGNSWCMEVCDTVEEIGYGQMVGNINVALSNFVFPAFFNPYASLPQNAPLDYLNLLTMPFSILPGGYAIVRSGGPGTEQQIFGSLVPQWKKDIKIKTFTRAARRNKKD
jgi:hypothetical protein